MCPYQRSRQKICFWYVPIGSVKVSVGVAFCLHPNLWTIGQIFKQTCTDTSLGQSKGIRFSLPWPYFQTSLWKSLVCTLSSEPMAKFRPNWHGFIIGSIKKMIQFRWPWPNFQCHQAHITTEKACLHSIFWTNARFRPNWHRYIIWRTFWNVWIFTVTSTGTFTVQLLL